MAPITSLGQDEAQLSTTSIGMEWTVRNVDYWASIWYAPATTPSHYGLVPGGEI